MIKNTRWLTVLIGLLAVMAVVSCEENKENSNDDGDEYGISAVTFVSGLDTPWQIAFLPDGRILVTERVGRVRVIENGQLKEEPYLNLTDSVIESGVAGLHGIAMDPDFATNGFIYVGYSYAENEMPLVIMNRLVRYRESNGLPTLDKVLLDNIEGHANHNLGPIHFGPDGKLYMPVGDRYIPEYAQDLNRLNGKILRMNNDGTIPEDNPFSGSYIYSYGHRNSQGLAWQPGTNNLFNTEHGPSQEQGCCLDEINLIEPGKNYGWPVIRGMQTEPNMETPVFYSGDTITWAPGGAAFVKTGPWEGSMIFTGLRGKALYRAVFDENDPTKITKVEEYFKGKYGRIRTVAVGPDNKIYMATSNGDRAGTVTPEDDRILEVKIE